jgi:Terminase large subunit, ATPase domain
MAGALAPGGLVRVDPVAFIEGRAPPYLRPLGRKAIHAPDVPARVPGGALRRAARPARLHPGAVGACRARTGKSEIAAAIGTKMLVADGTFGAEVISVAGDKRQARIVFDSAKRMVQFSPRLSATLRIFRDAIEDPSTDSVWRVMSADAPLKHGLRPSAVIFDELHVQPNRELWDVLESGFGSRTEPLMLGITTAGFNRASLLGDLVREGEDGKDPAFLYRWVGLPQGSELDYRDPKAWRLANPALSCRDPFLVEARLVEMARRLPENQFRRLHLNQWTSARDVAFPAGVWESAADTREIPDGTQVVVAFVAARERDTVAIVGCTLDDPHVFPIRVWEESERVDPSDVADELRTVWGTFSVVDLLVSEHDWTWVLPELAEEGLPVTKVPRSP